MSSRAVAQPEGVTYEMAIPLDGPAPLRAGPGNRFGVHLRVHRNGTAVASLGHAADPAAIRNHLPRPRRPEPGWDPDLDTPTADGTWDDPTSYPWQ